MCESNGWLVSVQMAGGMGAVAGPSGQGRFERENSNLVQVHMLRWPCSAPRARGVLQHRAEKILGAYQPQAAEEEKNERRRKRVNERRTVEHGGTSVSALQAAAAPCFKGSCV